jgi:zinc transporter ZupT
MTRDTKIRLALAVLVFMNLQAVLFGFGMMVVLYQPDLSAESGFFWIPVVIALSSVISAALSWWIAPHLRARFWRSKGGNWFIKWAGGGRLGPDWGHEHTFQPRSS